MFDRAENAYNDGLKADSGSSGGKRVRHLLYQSLASLNLERNRLKEAEYALLQSSRVSQDEDAPFKMRLDIARRFMNQGYFKPAGDYLRAVVRFQPDDAEAKRMLAAASAGRRL
jgi:predicted Zn-dependent protease